MSLTKTAQSTTMESGKRITPFGAVENPKLLLNLPKQNVLRIDTLACLRSLWGDNILMARQHLYHLVSGTVSDEEFQQLIVSYYKRYSAFANYVDEKYLFEDQQLPLIVRIISPIREMIREYEGRVIALGKYYSGEYLGTHQDYVYFVFQSSNFPEIGECERVC